MRQMPPSHYRSAPRAHQGANRRLLAPYMFARTERPTRLRVRATPTVRSPKPGGPAKFAAIPFVC